MNLVQIEKKKSIFVIDDHASTHFFFRSLIEHRSFKLDKDNYCQLHSSYSVEEAFEKLEQNIPNIILMDLDMPK